MFSVIAKCVSSRASPVPSLTAVLSCAVEIYMLVTFHNGFMFFLLRAAVSSTYADTDTDTDTCACGVSVGLCVGVCVCDCVCGECEWKAEEGRSGGGGGWSVCCVCRLLDSNLTADSLRSVPQDKNGAHSTASSVKANDWRTRERVVLDLFSDLEWVRSNSFFR